MKKWLIWVRILFAVLLLATAVAVLVWWNNKEEMFVEFGPDDRIELTPQEILRMERIGQWELLSVQTEVVVDTLRPGLLSDDRLVAIYKGTLRFGIDMNRLAGEWAVARNDTVRLHLPAVHLLDRNFVDEARTQVFYEEGEWSNRARRELYDRAYRKMMRQCHTPDNLQRAEENARTQFTAMFRAMGFREVEIRFGH